jgi:acyl-CoA synthetase (AMP-forming)/AMP-acid ligase II
VHDLLRAAAERAPDAVAIAEGGTETTYGVLWAAVGEFAGALTAAGAGRGGRVLVTARGALDTALAVYAASSVGATAAVVGDRYSDAQRTLVEQDFAPHVTVSAEGGERVVRPGPGGTVPEHDAALVVYTSGSSGRPAGVVCPGAAVSFSVAAIQRVLGYRQADRVLAIPPFSFDYGLYQLFLAAAAGASVRAVAPGDALATFARAAGTRPTVLPVLPALARACLPLARRWPAEVRAGVRLVTSTGAHLDAGVLAALRELFPRAGVVSMYGLTECKRTTISAVDEDLAAPGTAGRALPGTSVWVERDDGRRAGPGDIGQVVVRGPNVMAGYWRDPDRTRAVFRERDGGRELLTGDDGYLDDEGRLVVMGRRDGQVKVRGTRVAAAEVELAAVEADGVHAAALVDGRPGREPVLFVGGTASAVDLRRHLAGLLGTWKVPDDIRVLAALPVNDRGKVDRAGLRALAGQES